MNIIAIIPARMGSSRFPGKPLANICGMPMIGHVFMRTRMCKTLNDVYVATCDPEIVRYVESIGGKAVMTKDTHERASDRCAEAMLKIEAESNARIDILVMVQGDEPLTVPQMINEAIGPMLIDPSIKVTNLMAPLKTRKEHDDPNEVKVVVDKNNFALYFSREPIPSWKKGAKTVPMMKQVCIIPFTRDYLIEYTQMEPTSLEIIESVDMMRILENGQKVKMVPTQFDSKAVDTPEDLVLVNDLMSSDRLFKLYSRERSE